MKSGVLRAILVFTTTLLVKREDMSVANKMDFQRVTMSDTTKIMNNDNTNKARNNKYRGVVKRSIYKAPTPGLEYVVFEYGERMKPGSFKTMIELMAEHMASTLKKGRPEATKAIKNIPAGLLIMNLQT